MSAFAIQAQATRTFVSGVGDDVNPCSRTAPCKTFAGAISKTASGGEINVIDAGGFGAVTITKAITIDGGGSFASILASGTSGITINIPNPTANDNVILRNLNINGAGTGLDGIRYLSANSVKIDNCKVFGFTQQGIDANTATNGSLIVTNSTIERGTDGIVLNTSALVLVASLDNVHLHNLTGNGFNAVKGLAFVRNCNLGRITNSAVLSQNGATVFVDNCLLSSNGTAINAAAGGVIQLINNSIYSNNVGISALGTVTTSGNNRNVGNNVSGAPNGGLVTIQ